MKTVYRNILSKLEQPKNQNTNPIKIGGGGKGARPSAACVVSTFFKPKLLLVIKFKTNIFIRLNHVYVCYQVDYQI